MGRPAHSYCRPYRAGSSTELPEGGEPLAASTSAADNYDRLNDPFLPSWSSISEDDEVVWVSWSAPPLDDAEATEDTVSSSASAGALTIVDSDPEHAAVMSLLQIRAAPVSVVDKSSRQSAAVAPFSVPTPCGRACLPMPARDPPCPHSGTLSLSVLLQDSVQSTGDSDVNNLTSLVQCARLPWCDFWSLDLHSIPLPEHVRVFLQSLLCLLGSRLSYGFSLMALLITGRAGEPCSLVFLAPPICLAGASSDGRVAGIVIPVSDPPIMLLKAWP